MLYLCKEGGNKLYKNFTFDMKKILLIIGILLSFQAFSQQSIYTDENGDGIIEYSQVSKDGKLVEKGFYYNGKMVGTWTSYYPSGKKQVIAKFKSGVKHGTWYIYDSEGRIVVEVEYKDGLKVSATQHKYASN
jgi:antitoxin component YwqK of YwqJK toxin-antitoxin module